MSSIRKTETKPERVLRAALRDAGLLGYRKNITGLPGTPDVAFTRWRVAVFVDGMFWHGHPDYFEFGTKGDYWDRKIERNVERDREQTQALEALGWHVLRFWEMDVLRETARVVEAIRESLEARGCPAAAR